MWLRLTNVDPAMGTVREIPVNMRGILTFVATTKEQEIQFLGGKTILYPYGGDIKTLIVRETPEELEKLMELEV